MYITYYQDHQMHFGFMNVILLYSTYWQVLATRVTILRVVSAENKCIYSVLGTRHT